MESAAANETVLKAIDSPDVTAMNVFKILVCALGIFGNLFALFTLNVTRSSSNRKLSFMLTSLVIIDVLALAGRMFLDMINTFQWTYFFNNLWFCRAFVFIRFFGLASGCVVVIMSIDRWLMLTKTYFYLKSVSLGLLKRVTIVSWLGVLCLVCAPFFGFGLYWDENQTPKCVLNREAKKPLDVCYEYLFLSFGVFMDITIILTNFAVIKSLCMKKPSPDRRAITEGEIKYLVISLLICIIFVSCWTLQMFLVVLSMHAVDKKNEFKLLSHVAQVMLSLYFTLNPLMYVVLHWTQVEFICLRKKRGYVKTAGGENIAI